MGLDHAQLLLGIGLGRDPHGKDCGRDLPAAMVLTETLHYRCAVVVGIKSFVHQLPHHSLPGSLCPRFSTPHSPTTPRKIYDPQRPRSHPPTRFDASFYIRWQVLRRMRQTGVSWRAVFALVRQESGRDSSSRYLLGVASLVQVFIDTPRGGGGVRSKNLDPDRSGRNCFSLAVLEVAILFQWRSVYCLPEPT